MIRADVSVSVEETPSEDVVTEVSFEFEEKLTTDETFEVKFKVRI